MACGLKPNQQKHISYVDLCKAICQIFNYHYLVYLSVKENKKISFALIIMIVYTQSLL